jgi:hypothetical protein
MASGGAASVYNASISGQRVVLKRLFITENTLAFRVRPLSLRFLLHCLILLKASRSGSNYLVVAAT